MCIPRTIGPCLPQACNNSESVSSKVMVIITLMLAPLTRNGYRLLVRLMPTSNKAMSRTFNRKYTKLELKGLYVVASQVANMLTDEGLLGQVYVLGNNSHSFDEQSGKTVLGQVVEPSFLHLHIVFRGNPQYEYISGIKLEGPYPGNALVVKSRYDDKSTLDKTAQKIAWKQEEIPIALAYFQSKIKRLQSDFDLQMIDNTKPFDMETYVALIDGSQSHVSTSIVAATLSLLTVVLFISYKRKYSV
eukprot:538434_1